jgi:hypothetical protein
MKYLCILALFLGCGASVVVAAPLSGCFNGGPGIGFVCDLFEEDANGNPSEIGWLVTLPSSGNPTNYLILEPGTTDPTNRANWSDMSFSRPQRRSRFN